MFTGIIQGIGEIRSMEMRGDDARVVVGLGSLAMTELQIGDSIATQGVCLTVVELGTDCFAADVSAETLSCTTFAELRSGAPVNLELSVTASTRLGGHMVSGHVDGVARVLERTADGRSERFLIQAPAQLAKYIAEKGSVCIDGISLTVNKVDGACFDLNIVPHTLTATTMGRLQANSKVNLEVDVVARYLERLMSVGADTNTDMGNIDESFLQRHGFV